MGDKEIVSDAEMGQTILERQNLEYIALETSIGFPRSRRLPRLL